MSDVDSWVMHMSIRAKIQMIGEITALTWAYEKSSQEYLAVEMVGEFGGDMSLTFLTGQPDASDRLSDIESTCFEVVDMVEARKLTALFLSAAGVVSFEFPRSINNSQI